MRGPVRFARAERLNDLISPYIQAQAWTIALDPYRPSNLVALWPERSETVFIPEDRSCEWFAGSETWHPKPISPDGPCFAHADLAVILASGVAVWFLLLRRRDFSTNALLELSTLAAMSLLPVYHRLYDAALLLLPLAWSLAAVGRVEPACEKNSVSPSALSS